MKRNKLKPEAIQLRLKERLSVQSIAERLRVAKSTAWEWVKEYPLSPDEFRRRSVEESNTKRPLLTKTCAACNVEFVTTNKRRIHCSTTCSQRLKDRRRKERLISRSESVIYWRQRAKRKAIEYKGGKCNVCGYSRSIRALKFHHINPEEKEFGISAVTRSWENIKKELDKCILVCGNCHDEIHEGLIKL